MNLRFDLQLYCVESLMPKGVEHKLLIIDCESTGLPCRISDAERR